MRNVLSGLGAGIVLSVLSSAAFAGTACPAEIEGNVTPSSACELGSSNNDNTNPPPLDVNEDEMFGFTDWVFAAKDNDVDGEDEDGGQGVEFEVDGDTISGTFRIVGLYDQMMLVLKGGGGNIAPDVYVGYLLDLSSAVDDTLTGTYLTAFVNANNGNAADISHITIYVRGERRPPDDVPAPAALGLLGLGLLGSGLALRRRK